MRHILDISKMFKGLKDTLIGGRTQKRKSGSAFDLEYVANPSKSPLPHQKAGRSGDDLRQPASFFSTQVQQAGLHQMTLELEVWKTGAGAGAEATVLKVPATRFLEEGKDADKVHNYNFEAFLSTFEEKLNNSDPANPTEIMFGQLGFLDNIGIFEAVGDQDSLGVALNNLYLNRGNNNVLTFIFQPELDDNRKRRLQNKRTQFDEGSNTTEGKPGRRRTFPAESTSKIFHRNFGPERINPFLVVNSVESGELPRRPNTATSSQSSPLTGKFAIPRRESKHTLGLSPPSPRSTSSGRQSRVGSIAEAVKKVVKKSVKMLLETKNEERERFKFLCREE
jgi:hypothetical protein